MDVRVIENKGRSVCWGGRGVIEEESEPGERLQPMGKQPLSQQRQQQGGVL